jgi:pilus assembly protein Flp/PilA
MFALTLLNMRGEQANPSKGAATGITGRDPMSTFVIDFLRREDGPTAVEYAVMLALIIVVCIAAITALGTNANATFTSVSNTIGSTAS